MRLGLASSTPQQANASSGPRRCRRTCPTSFTVCSKGRAKLASGAREQCNWPCCSISEAPMKRLGALGITISLGLMSRLCPIGWPLYDKSLGDVLYAVAAYLFLALVLFRVR